MSNRNNLRAIVQPASNKPLLKRPGSLPLDIRQRKAVEKRMSERITRTTYTPAQLRDKADKRGDSVLEVLQKIRGHSDSIVKSFTVDRNFIGRGVTVTTTPVRLIESSYARGYKILNPAASAGLTTTGTVIASASYAAGASGNTQGASLNVANYRSARLWLDITAISGATITIDTQSQDAVTGNWATTQASIFSETTTGTSYVNLGTEGVDTNFAIAYSVTGGTATFSISYALKDGLAGSSTGLNNTAYIGPLSDVNSTIGYPILEGQSFEFYTAPNTEMWAVSELSGGLTLKIFELQ